MIEISFAKVIVLVIIAALVLGPTKLPEYAAKLGRVIRELRRMASGAQEQIRQEIGPEFDNFDWRKMDPRQYDPRRIIREALIEEETTPAPPSNTQPARPASSALQLAAGQRAPFDDEST